MAIVSEVALSDQALLLRALRNLVTLLWSAHGHALRSKPGLRLAA